MLQDWFVTAPHPALHLGLAKPAWRGQSSCSSCVAWLQGWEDNCHVKHSEAGAGAGLTTPAAAKALSGEQEYLLSPDQRLESISGRDDICEE